MTTTSWVRHLLDWYQANKRDLPWRQSQEPYAIWVSEIMLQQTRVETVIDYYHRFMQRFPRVEDLAQADIDEVLKLWEGLGYYSRAKNLHRAAQEIVQGGHGFPTTHAAILALPGIGRYTAGAIMSIAYHQPYPAVDGNVLRVMSRLLLLEKDISSPKVKTEIETTLKNVFPPEAADFSQGLMELGALICLPTSPRCAECPLVQECQAYGEQRQHQLPIKKAKAEPKRVKRYLALIQRGDDVLMNKRPEQGLLAGLWEFPGVEAKNLGEFIAEFEAVYGFPITPKEHAMDTQHVFTHRVWDMKVYRCDYQLDEIAKTSLQWISLGDLNEITIPGAFQPIKQQLQRNQ